MSKKGHVDGKKISGKHTTVRAEAKRVVERLTSPDCPDQGVKCSPGIMKSASNGKFRIKISDMKMGERITGLRLMVRGPAGLQEIRVNNVSHPWQVRRFLEQEFPEAMAS